MLSIGSLLLNSCRLDKFNFNKMDEINLASEWWVPFAEIELNVSDIKLDTNFIKTDNEGFVSIIFRVDTIVNQELPPFITIPDQEPIPLPVIVGSPPINITTGLGTFGGAELESVIFDTLRFNYIFDANTPNNVDAEIAFAGFLNDGVPYNFSLTTSASSPAGQVHTVELYNATLDLSNNGTSANTISVSAQVIDGGSLNNGDPVSVSFFFSKLVPREVNGFVGTRTVQVPPLSFPLNLRGIERFADGLFLSNPIIRFEFYNGAGVPFRISPNLSGVTNNNNLKILELPNLDFAGSSQTGTAALTNIQLDRNNTNIPDFIASLPKQMYFSGNLQTNPNGAGGTPNFVSTLDRAVGNMEFELPMEFSAKDMTYEQRLENISIWNDNPDFIESLTLGLRSENGFPFDLIVEAVFIDSRSNLPIDSIVLNVMDPAAVDANGRVTQTKKMNVELELDQDNISNLLKSNALVIRAKLNTPDGGNTAIKIYDDYFFKSSLSLKAKLNIKPSDLNSNSSGAR